jgi:zona occludens toxin (predicted ATPase)
MITLYSGLPGSGKSFHATQRILYNLTKRKKTVISTRDIKMDIVTKNGRRKTGKFIYIKNADLTVEWLIDYARENHVENKESQALVVIEEAGIKFQARNFMESTRNEWLEFFATHRHYGYDFIFVSQMDRQIDRQIRYCIEYDIRHKAANNFKTIGLLLTGLRIKMFICVKYWYQEKLRDSAETIFFKKSIGKLYNSMEKYNEKGLQKERQAQQGQMNQHTQATAQSPHRHAWEGTAQAGGAYARQTGHSGSQQRPIPKCHTRHCTQCKAINICKMPWKHLPPHMKGITHHDARRIS